MTTLTWTFGAFATSMLLAMGGVLLERAAAEMKGARRWGWAVALALMIALPAASALGVTLPWPLVALTDGAGLARTVLPPVAVAPGTHAEPNAIRVVVPAFAALWAMASMLLLGRILASHRLIIRARARWERARIDGTPVLVSDGEGPAVAGVRAPVIVIPRWALALAPDERAIVLAHERAHVESRDTLLLLLGRVVVALVPWNIVAWYAERRLRLAVELDCDARVLSHRVDPRRYGAALLRVAERGGRGEGGMMLAATLSEPYEHLERRITAMTTVPRRRPARAFAASISALVVFAMSFVAACGAGEVSTESKAKRDIVSPAATPNVPTLTVRGDTITVHKLDGQQVNASASAPADPAALDAERRAMQVDKPATQIFSAAMVKYPDALRKAGVQGEVLVSFVVDTTGSVDVASFKVERATDARFADAVRAALPDLRFSPARVKRRKVRQVVTQPFTFALSR